MRPLQRPLQPIQTPKNYKSYLESLLLAFGQYCSYCERLEKLDVEHVIPSSKQPALIVDWTNLLLGCARCNRDFKKDRNDSRAGFIWPDQHDTFHALVYLPDGRVQPAPGPENADANATLQLVKLEDTEHQAVLNLARRQKFKQATRMLMHYKHGHTTLAALTEEAQQGYWSVWMTVCAAEPLVVNALLEPASFPGTNAGFFPKP